MTERSFRIVAVSHADGVDFTEGVYHGERPRQAAKKAFNRYCNKAGLKKCVRRFTIEEITKGSPHKQYHYVGTHAHIGPSDGNNIVTLVKKREDGREYYAKEIKHNGRVSYQAVNKSVAKNGHRLDEKFYAKELTRGGETYYIEYETSIKRAK